MINPCPTNKNFNNTQTMKKYTSPSCKVMTVEGTEMIAASLDVDNGKTSTDGGWTRGQGWNANDWSAADDVEE